ncbi:hypothetical protein ACTNDP_22920 [Paenibacillus barengoltzii]|jgi:hypothetical protein|uniref:hypothetical protein n=1 Tax=Paenibacillus barengoltzii TaxID=343517 RepID=UPI003F8A5B45
MPPYFSVHFSFPYSSFSSTFVDEIYQVCFKHFPYKSGYWMSEKNTLDEIINWNSGLLAKKFKLGFDQHVKHDYKHILLDSTLYSHLRLFWIYQTNEITLHLIVPESDVLNDGNTSNIIPILNLSIDLWRSHTLNVIQTYHELGAPVSLRKISKGSLPSSEPFSILSPSKFQQIRSTNDYISKQIMNGVLIVQEGFEGLINGADDFT